MPKSAHPGVYLIPRTLADGSVRYRAKYQDPDTGRMVWETLDPQGLPNKKSRLRWLKEKSKSLARRRAEISSGAPRRTRTCLETAIEVYLAKREKAGKSARTITNYERELARFSDWAKSRGIAYVEDVNKVHLVEFQESQEARRKRVAARSGRRGERRVATVRVAPQTVNGTLRAVTTFFNYQRKRGRTPLLARTEIGEALAKLKEPQQRAVPLWPPECRALLQAAMRHDSATFKLTRAEHRAAPSAVALNRTPRYAPIAPFVAFVLLTGMRLGEARALRWCDVHLSAADVRGEPVGAIRVDAATSKKRAARQVDLSVSPALRSLLTRLKTRSGGARYVFGAGSPVTEARVESARRRLVRSFGAPEFNWQRLRKTCGSYLTCSPGIFGSASAYRSAAQLGHSVAVAEKHYLGVLSGIPQDARTLEAVLGIASELDALIHSLTAPHDAAPSATSTTCDRGAASV